jgi:hypothetical protein
MLDRSRASLTPRMRRVAPLVAAAIALAIGAWLTYAGIDYAYNGCDCNRPWYPDWLWIPIIALAALFCAAALALSAWALTQRDPRTDV